MVVLSTEFFQLNPSWKWAADGPVSFLRMLAIARELWNCELFVRYSAGSIYAGGFQRPSLRPGVLIVSEMQQLQIRAREMAEQVEALAAHTWQPEVDSGNPQKGGRREVIPQSCPLTAMAWAHACTSCACVLIYTSSSLSSLSSK